MHHASLSRPYIMFRLGSQAWGVRLIQFGWHANHMLMIFVCKQSFERPKTRKWFILENCVVFIFISVVSKTAHYVMYMYVYILIINAIRLFVFDLTRGLNGLAICVHVWLCLLWVNFLFLLLLHFLFLLLLLFLLFRLLLRAIAWPSTWKRGVSPSNITTFIYVFGLNFRRIFIWFPQTNSHLSISIYSWLRCTLFINWIKRNRNGSYIINAALNRVK